MFEETKISWLFFIILVIVAIIIIVCAGLYMLWNYHLGKPLAPFFWLRIKGWTQRGIALFEIFNLTNSVDLEEARKEVGDGYRLFSPSIINMPTEKTGKISKFMKYITKYISGKKDNTPSYGVTKVKRIQNLIMPKSTYSINGVTTIPLWDLHPQLHTDLLEGVKVLITKDIKTLEDLKIYIEDKEQAEQNMFKNYNYRTFYDLFLGVRQKYNVIVTTDDVANFIGKQFDKNYRESIEAKDFNVMQQNKADSKINMYGWIAIILTVVIIGFKIIYTVIYK